MSSKKIKVYYFYPTVKIVDKFRNEKLVLANLEPILTKFKDMNVEERVFPLKEDEDNIQLKIIKEPKNNRWEIGFLRNTKDSSFKSKLEEEINEAEPLEEDEFIGQECCMIYDGNTNVVSLQNNSRSVSFKYLGQFFNNFIEDRIDFTPITLRPEYSNISEEDEIKYKNITLSFLDISEIHKLAVEENNKSVEMISRISNNLEALSGKIELSVGRTKYKFLKKLELKEIVKFFKRYPKLTNGLKVKAIDGDNIRVIDLIQNKLYDEFSIAISKDDRKTFEKILYPMNGYLDSTLESSLQYCIKFTEN